MELTEGENQNIASIESMNSALAGNSPKPKQYLEQIIESAISTPLAEKIVFTQGEKVHETRAQIHGLLLGKFGSGRTTSILKLPNHFYLTEYTLPGLIGSINAQGRFIEGAIRNAAGKVLIVDEVQNIKKNAKNALLSLLEEQRASRALGYEVPNIKPGRNALKKYYDANIINGNTLSVTCRFSCICSGVYASTRTQVDMAWVSRFFPIKVFRTLNDIKKLTRGELSYDIKAFPYKHKVYFKNYMKFNDRYYEIIENPKMKSSFMKTFLDDDSEKGGFLSRNCNDIARLACYFAGKDGVVEVTDEHYERALLYAPTSLYNYLNTDLGEIDYKIMSIYATAKNSPSQLDLSNIIGIDQTSVSRHISRLISKGLLEKREV